MDKRSVENADNGKARIAADGITPKRHKEHGRPDNERGTVDTGYCSDQLYLMDVLEI